MDEWLNDYVEIELKKQRPKTALDKILEEGYTKTGLDLKHFDVYKKENKRLLYNRKEKVIDMIYDMEKVFSGYRGVSFSSKKFEDKIGKESLK